MSPIRTPDEFEHFGVFWLQHLARTRHAVPAPVFQTYGSRGQDQQGLDLLPLYAHNGIVGQCKYWEGVLSLPEIEKDLAKSDRHPGKIEHFYFLTTGKRDTRVQQQSVGGYFHTRPCGTRFLVHVEYFADLDPRLEFLPAAVREQLAGRMPFLTSMLDERATRSPDEFLKSQRSFRSYMLRNIPPAAVDVLEFSDWRSGTVAGAVVDPFNHVHFEYDRARHVLEGIEYFAHEGDRAELVAGVLYGRPFLDAVRKFRMAYVQHVHGEMINGVYTLVANDHPHHHLQFSKVGSNERMEVVHLYRTLVQGIAAT